MTITVPVAPHAAAQINPTTVYCGNATIQGGMMGGVGGVVGIGGGGGVGGGGGGGAIVFGYQHPPTTAVVTGNVSYRVKYLINGKDPPEGSEFAHSPLLFVSDYELNETNRVGYHYIVWVMLFEDQFDDYGTIIKNNYGVFPAFGSERTKTHFEAWLLEYKRIFFQNQDIETATYPVPTGDVRGLWIEDRDTVDLNADWLWIVKYYKHPVIRMGRGWLFENDTDAIHFKMR